MVTYYVDKDEVYNVAATVTCTIYDAKSSIIATCEAGASTAFKAPTNKIVLTDNNAVLSKVISASEEFEGFAEHLNNSTIHVSASEKANWDNAANKLPGFQTHIDTSNIHVTAEQKAALNDPTLNERVLNIPELFVGAGGGVKYDMFTLEQALSRANEYITSRGLTSKITGGLKVKFKTMDGYYMEYMWDGIGAITDQTAWTSYVSSSEINKTELDGKYAAKKYDTPNAILITDENGNIVASTIISVAELNTLNNNTANLKTKLADLESRLAALENA